MDKMLKIIILNTTLLLALVCNSVGQTVPWGTPGGASTMSVIVNGPASEFHIDNVNLVQGDYIGAFVGESGSTVQTCIGYVMYTPSSANTMTIFQPGGGFNDTITFKVWKYQENCVLHTTSTSVPSWNYVYSAGANHTMTALSGSREAFSYPALSYCDSDPDPLPYSPTDYETVSFTSSTSIDANSGQFFLSMASQGIYIVDIATDACLTNYSVEVHVTDCSTNSQNIISPSSSDPSYVQYYFDCSGEVNIFNRVGHPVRKLTAPAYWDGTDENGNLLPADEYYASCGGAAPIVLTIIR